MILLRLYCRRSFKWKLGFTRWWHLRISRSWLIILLTVLSPWINFSIELSLWWLSNAIFVVLLCAAKRFWQPLIKLRNFILEEKVVVKNRNLIFKDLRFKIQARNNSFIKFLFCLKLLNFWIVLNKIKKDFKWNKHKLFSLMWKKLFSKFFALERPIYHSKSKINNVFNAITVSRQIWAYQILNNLQKMKNRWRQVCLQYTFKWSDGANNFIEVPHP